MSATPATTDKDRALLALLTENARASITELADRLGVTRATAQKRLARLEQSGAIAGYTVVLADAAADTQVRAHVSVIVRPKSTPSVIADLRVMAEVRAVHSVSGDYDLIAEIAAPDVAALDRAIDAVIAIPGVERTRSAVILSTKFAR